LLASYSKLYPDLTAELKRRIEGRFPKLWNELLPSYSPSDPAVATRKLSEAVLNKIAPMLPELMGGSADLTGSNLTRWKSATDFQSVFE
jgi:transketolase